jgi:hypothetical protein
MARQPRGRDWQERAYDEAELKRRDSKSGVPSDAPDPLRTPSTDVKRRSSWRLTAIAIIIVLGAIIVRVDLNNRAPSLTTSCTTPALALSSTSPHVGSTVRWSATGPANANFVITLGITALTRGSIPGHLRGVPEPGHTGPTTEEAVPTTALSKQCKASGSFSVTVPAGHYTVRMFRLQGSGAHVSGTSVASKVLAVSS